jgi:UDP-hydrolysing UDP-N-acetyl-D-glucosamine 2-epimerase
MTRKIAVFTGTRAEYGLLFWLMKAIEKNPALELQVIVSGAHLSPQFGETWKQIEADGFTISAKVDLQLADDTPLAITHALARGVAGCGEALAKLNPDILVVLGDRYEALAAAQAAMIARIPIAHIHGGESTEGLIDEAIRHAITKMAHLHFVAAEPFRTRVLQLGENPEHVWVVGAAGLDNIAHLPIVPKAELEKILGLRFASPLLLLTYHPETLHTADPTYFLEQMLNALGNQNGTIVITGTNADTGGGEIRRTLQAFAAQHPENIVYIENLGVSRYLSLMRCADVVVGNSSSGLLEAPAIGTPSINIGNRQRGRLSAPSVINCPDNIDAIHIALKTALSSAHREIAAARLTPYGSAGAAERIVKIISNFSLTGILEKRFFSLQ